jgi:hypothetical protein
VDVFSSLNLVVKLFQVGIIDKKETVVLLQQLEHINAHGAEEILEAYHLIDKMGEK